MATIENGIFRLKQDLSESSELVFFSIYVYEFHIFFYKLTLLNAIMCPPLVHVHKVFI